MGHAEPIEEWPNKGITMDPLVQIVVNNGPSRPYMDNRRESIGEVRMNGVPLRAEMMGSQVEQ